MTTRRLIRQPPQLHFVYWIAVMASGVATFGSLGWLAGGAVLMLWGFTLFLRFWDSILLTIIALLLSVPLVVPAYVTAHRPPRPSCQRNIRNLGLAVLGYHAVQGSLPPAYIADEEGRPMHSWRVLVLPYLEGGQELYDGYDFDEPWDGPHNRSLIERMPADYYCPSEADSDRVRRGCTSYVAVTGERTLWPGSESRTLEDVADGTSWTLLLIEENAEEIYWTEPRDFSVEESLRSMHDASPDFRHGHRNEKRFSDEEFGRFGILADGRSEFLPHGIDGDQWRSLVRLDDGRPQYELMWSMATGILKTKPIWTKRIVAAVSLAVFILLALLPLAWVWRKPTDRGTPALPERE